MSGRALADAATPLQRRLDHLGRLLATVGVGLIAVIFALDMVRVSLSGGQWLIAVAVGASVLLVHEVGKTIARTAERRAWRPTRTA